MRVAMARVLLGEPDVLLMDEPTNHLDIESIIWLEAFLKARSGALLMTTHDRDFMNRVVTRIAEIDGGEITSYSGNYDFYERERAIREANREAAYARQQAMLAKEQRFIDRFAAHAAKAAQVQSRVKALEKIEKIELPKKRRVVKFEFRPPPRSGELVATLEGVSKRYGRRVVHDDLTLTIRRGERWCGDGQERRRQVDAAEDDRRARSRPTRATVTLGASLKMGYFAQQALDLLDADLTVEEQLQKDFPHESIGVLREPGGRVSVLRRRSRQEDPVALGRREDAARDGADAARSAELPGARRADQPSRPGHQGNAARVAGRVRGDDDLRLARPGVPARPEQPRARTRRRERHRRGAARVSRLLCRLRCPDRPRGARRTRDQPSLAVAAAAQLLDLAPAPLRLQPPFARGGVGAGRAAFLRTASRLADQRDQAFARGLPVLRLCPVFATVDDQDALGSQPARSQHGQPALDLLGQGRRATVEAKLHRRGDLVHVLAARAGGADEPFADLALVELDAFQNPDHRSR